MSSLATDSPAVRSRTGFAWALGLLLSVPIAKAVLADSIDPDFFWHVRVAEQLLTHGIGPVPDPFSFMSQPGTWTPFSWLGELLMKWTFDAGGLAGIVGVHALCSTLFFGFIALACLEATRHVHHEPRRLATLAAVAFAMMLSLAFLSFRPVTMALALMAGMTWLLWRDRRARDRWVWLLVPAAVLLTNLHLYVILFVVGLWARTTGRLLDEWAHEPTGLWRRSRRDVLLASACSVAALCTPMLPGCIRNAIWFNSHDPMVQHALVAEIAPFYAGLLGKVLLAGVAVISVLAVRAWRRLGFENLLWLLAATAFLFQMGRFAAAYALVAMPIAAAALPLARDAVLARRPLQVAAALGMLLVLGRVGFGFPRAGASMDAWLTRTGDADSLRYPTDAVAYLERDVPRRTGRLLNELTWGGYLIWRLGDRYQVFMDGRTLIYPASFWERIYLEGDVATRGLLAEQTADAAILPVHRSRLHRALVELGWREVYADSRARVMVPPVAVTDTK